MGVEFGNSDRRRLKVFGAPPTAETIVKLKGKVIGMSMKNNLKKIIFCLLFSFALVAVISGNVESVNAGTRWSVRHTYKSKPVVLKTKKAASKKISKGLNRFDKKITLYVSKNLFKNYNEFLNTLHGNAQYNDLYGKVECSMLHYRLYKYDKIELFVKYKTTKAKFKKFKAGIIRSEKEFIDRMVKQAKKYNSSFSVSVSKKVANMRNKKSSKKLYNKLRNDVEFADISAHGYKLSTITFGTYWTMKAELKPEITKEDVKNLDRFIKTWVAENITADMTEFQKVRKIFEFMTMEYAYSYGDNGEDWYKTGDNNKKARLGNYDIHTSFALVFKKAGVCSGYSRLFYRLAKEAGLEVRIILGKTAGGSTEGHAWNMVQVDGKWYHIDVTWGRGKYYASPEVYINWKYFLKGDDTMGDDAHKHIWDKNEYPQAYADYPINDETGEEVVPNEDGTSDGQELSIYEPIEEPSFEKPIPDYTQSE